MTGSTAHKLYLLIHTMTITDSDFIVRAQFFHTFLDNLTQVSNARLVGRRLSFGIHPNLRSRRRLKAGLQGLHIASLRTLMKRNSANIKHHLRAIHIGPQNSNGQIQISSLIENDVVAQQAPIYQPTPHDEGIDKKETPKKVLTEEQLSPDASPDETSTWLTLNRFDKYLHTFASFSGSDMLRMSREDLIQICGHADGIRLYNVLHSKTIAPKLKIYVCRDNSSVFNAIFLSSHSNLELMKKLAYVIGVPYEKVRDIYMEGPHAIHIQLSNDLIRHIKEDTMFTLEILQDNGSYIFLLKKSVV